MRTFRRTLMIVALMTAATLAQAKDVAVVSSKSAAARAFTLAEFTKALKSPAKKWADGKEVTVVVPDMGSPEARIFAQKVLGQSLDEFKAFISSANQTRKVFIVVGSDSDVIKSVDATPGSIGLVDIYSITGSVGVVKVDGKLPLEPGYALHGT